MSVVCFHCKEPIVEGQVIQACNKAYHPSHFFCKGCGELMKDGNYQEIRRHPYCLGCATAMGAIKSPKCVKCGKDIHGKVIDLKMNKYHPECFTCFKCDRVLAGEKTYEKEGNIYCQFCYVENAGLLCHTCNRIIEGKFMKYGDKKFHPECFVCAVCGVKLKDTFTIHGRNLYCPDHRYKHIGYKCYFCDEMIDKNDTTAITADGKRWHAGHFRCYNCKEQLYEHSCRNYLNRVYCPICYDSIVLTQN